MAYTQLTMSPATIEFARQHGATGLHIGILGALPTATLFMQFIAAVVVNHLTFRRRLWFTVSIIQRLALMPLAICPLLFPEAPGGVWIWTLIALTAANHGMLHFGSPLWLSWMGDYLPHNGLNRYWGRRHIWMQWTAAASLLAGGVLLLGSGWGINVAFAVLIVAGAVAGVADILFFVKVEEPPVKPLPQPTLSRVFSAPFKDSRFRSFITYACFWNFAAMIGAPFISLFLLDYLGMSLASVLMLWAASWAGGALLSRRIGRLAEAFGSRPLLILCTLLKPINMVALLVVPFTPSIAMWILVPTFVIDALLNAGIAVANNGFMLKNSPQENRSMYIAAGTALAGMVGGLTAIVAGGVLTLLGSWSIAWGGVPLVGYHALFAASLLLRVVSVYYAWRVEEPGSHSARHVMLHLIGATPLRTMRFPVGLYRGSLNDEDFDAIESELASADQEESLSRAG